MGKTNGRTRVLETIRQGKIGGGESHVLDLVASLDKSAFDPIVLSFTEGPMITALQKMDIPVFVIESEKAFDISVWKKVKKFMQDQRIDIVHVHGTRANTNVLWAARRLGLPVVYTIHGWSFHDGLHPLAKRLRIAAEKFITGKTQVNICVSESNRQTGIKAFKDFTGIVVRNGVNLQKFNPDQQYPDLRAEYGIPENKLLICFIARMTYQKDPVCMVKGFAAALQQAPDLHLLMIGDGELMAAAVNAAAEAGVEKQVTFAGFRQDVPAVLHAGDIYCLPSLWEGFPIGVLEAMAMGKAVIASDVDGTKEAVKDGENGLLVPSGNPAALGAAIVRVAKDHTLRTTLQNNAKAAIAANFNVAGMTEKIAAVYQQLCK
ncbi:Glycosyltransferase involved in cell wall bisynthesis [Chitinophaga ginsengisegetis]|uniref:Glycosyltransferase involved in cell wall bisynthesis n=1 Tax=Chitinophaga ginsengisegetis TaxID=393003 RepID=A0A1T5N3A6_9BACT|nr:glycosyltransferase family 4 protein [Chitinophaga ginsengisegetis]MDR6567619.1 glycosyltransferase involved in cell wall biosynthesis [Chitinophaga ginsengisegetis]MDR6647826.1 glycosyltransferase involved in cell wall biosynthesis [Chitinophaga ginsengisegetis]MDR6654176.1 glycosyltransferase involved in cell wall biosynthesis [Chitinophaga ginsengisegetis]SKC94649.1 Glycosyltransferase involved in cell wall bisynthesis [Chitinophaga ginsengisegetis]